MGFYMGNGFELMFGIVFTIVIGTFIFTFIKGISGWHKNNQSPKLTVDAVIVSKRTDMHHHRHANAGDASGAHGYHSSTSTTYYVCFQVESGDRMELQMDGREYGLLAEGDYGRLSFQGTRYLGFERTAQER